MFQKENTLRPSSECESLIAAPTPTLKTKRRFRWSSVDLLSVAVIAVELPCSSDYNLGPGLGSNLIRYQEVSWISTEHGRCAQRGAASRFLIPISILLVISVGWNVWTYQLDRKRHAEIGKVEYTSKNTAVLAAKEAELTESKRQARDAKTDARVQQLYDEINQLTKLSERVLLPEQAIRATPPAADDSKDHGVRVR